MCAAPASQAAWALQLPLDSATAALALRLVPGVEVRADHAALWLRGRIGDEALQRQLLRLPACARYAWFTETGALRPIESRLASEKLPTDGWQPLRAWATVQMPPAALPARTPPPIALQLVPSTQVRPATAWLGPLATFAEWTATAPRVRLARLRFAVCTDRRCLVLGTPTPPVPGRVFIAEDGLVTPAGLAWQPHASALVIRRAFGAAEETVILWDESGARFLPEELFVPVSRGAVRATIHGLSASQPP